jgi:hypothetical protein
MIADIDQTSAIAGEARLVFYDQTGVTVNFQINRGCQMAFSEAIGTLTSLLP